MLDPMHVLFPAVQRVRIEHSMRADAPARRLDDPCASELPEISITCLVLSWLGKRLVQWGLQLQERYRADSEQPVLTYSRR